jgi:opacity protein-like surface antigen
MRWARGSAMVLLAVALLGAAAAHAESIGSPATVLKKGEWLMGMASEFVLGRQVDNGADLFMYGAGHSRGYGLTDWLSVYGTIGAAHVSAEDSTIVTSSGTSGTHGFGLSVLLSGSLKARLLQRDTWELDAALRYTDLRARRKNKNELRWHHVQLAGSVAKSLGRMKPYAGGMVTLLNVKYRIRDNSTTIKQDRYRHDTPVGMFLGTDVYFGEEQDVVLNVEATFADGPGLGASISYKF